MHRNLGIYAKVIPRVTTRYLQKKPFSVSFDITRRCNVPTRCPYCYYYTANPPRELPDEEMLHHIKQVTTSGNFFHATFIGGEPTLRLPILQEAVRLFPQSWVNTNGLNGFPPEVKTSAWLLSLDGPREFHDKIKGDGAFDKAVDAITESSSTVVANATLYTLNCEYAEEFAHKMAKTDIDGVIYSFYTPLKNGDDDGLHLSDCKRNELIQRIFKIKREYPDFIFFTPRMGHYQNPLRGLSEWNHPSRCPVAVYGLAYGVDGRVKHPCAMGGGTVGDRCGCGMNSIFLSLMRGDIQTIRFLYKML